MTTTAADPDDVTIRRAEQADLLAVSRIEEASFPQPWPYGAFVTFLSEPGFLVALEDDAVVGYVVAERVSREGTVVGHVKDLAVAPAHRDRGIGTRLLERAFAAVTARGAERARLEVREDNAGAIRLYRRFGFERDHVIPGYYADGEDALVLVADLSEQ